MSWKKTLNDLESGIVRAAEKISGQWFVNLEVKKDILEAFRAGEIIKYDSGFVDKDNLGPREFSPKDHIRFVPGGSSVRRGSFIGEKVIIMPPSYINVGAFIDTGTMIDSHVLVGSCAQVGKNVHLSAGVKLGGVLEPIGETPVIIEDDVFVGAGCLIVEGIQVLKGAVLAPGVILSKGIPIYDCVHEKILPPGSAVPSLAVVIPGTRPHRSQWAKENGLQMNCALIVKYKDEKTSAALELEKVLR